MKLRSMPIPPFHRIHPKKTPKATQMIVDAAGTWPTLPTAVRPAAAGLRQLAGRQHSGCSDLGREPADQRSSQSLNHECVDHPPPSHITCSPC